MEEIFNFKQEGLVVEWVKKDARGLKRKLEAIESGSPPNYNGRHKEQKSSKALDMLRRVVEKIIVDKDFDLEEAHELLLALSKDKDARVLGAVDFHQMGDGGSLVRVPMPFTAIKKAMDERSSNTSHEKYFVCVRVHRKGIVTIEVNGVERAIYIYGNVSYGDIVDIKRELKASPCTHLTEQRKLTYNIDVGNRGSRLQDRGEENALGYMVEPCSTGTDFLFFFFFF